MKKPESLKQLIEALQKFPGVGPRAARRMATSVLFMKYDDALELSRAVLRVKKKIVSCSICNAFTESDPCDICSDDERDHGFICVVQNDEDVEAFERAKSHSGVYHVLGGAINPNKGHGPERIKARELFERVSSGDIREILLATDTSVAGDATAVYLLSRLRKSNVRVTRLARGIPMGADIDYLDGETLCQAFSARRELSAPEEEENHTEATEEK